MANENEVKINLETKATGDGAAVTKKGLEEVNKAAGMPGLKTYGEDVEDAAAAMKILSAATENERKLLIKYQEELKRSSQARDDAMAQMQKRGGSAASVKNYDQQNDWNNSNQSNLDQLTKTISERIRDAEATEKQAVALKELNEQVAENVRLAVQKRQREEDVVKAQQLVRDRAANAPATGMGRELATGTNSALASAAGKAAIVTTGKLALDALETTLLRFKDLRKEVAGGAGDLGPFNEALLETAKIISSPMEALKNGLMSLAGLDDLEESVKWAKQVADQCKRIVELQRESAEEAANNSFERAMQRRRQDTANLSAELQRQLNLLNAIRSLEETKATAQDKEAIAKGADPNAVAAAAVKRQAEAEMKKREDELQQKENERDAAAKALTEATNVYTQKQTDKAPAAEVEQAFRAMDAAYNASAEASKEFANAQAIAATQNKETIVQAKSDMETQLQGNAEKQTEVIERLRDGLQEQADALEKSGGTVSGEFKRRMDNIDRMLTDLIPDNQQTAALYENVMGAIAASGKLTEDFMKDLVKAKQEITALQNAFDSIKNQVRDLPPGR